MTTKLGQFEEELDAIKNASGDKITYEDESAIMDRLEDLGYR